MDYKEFIENDKEAREFLDTINILKFLPDDNYISVLDLMKSLEDRYENKDLPEVFEGYLFNYMNEEDFADYLRKRYNFNIWPEEITHYYIINTPNDKRRKHGDS